jgi:hypothetical protein
MYRDRPKLFEVPVGKESCLPQHLTRMPECLAGVLGFGPALQGGVDGASLVFAFFAGEELEVGEGDVYTDAGC